MTNNILFAAMGKAAKVYGVSRDDLIHHYRHFSEAPAELKQALLLGYKILKNYQQAPAVEAEA